MEEKSSEQAKILATRIDARAIELGLTSNAEIERRGGGNRKRVGDWRAGKSEPGGIALVRLANALETTAEFLVSGVSSYPSFDPDNWTMLPRRDLLAYARGDDGQWVMPPVIEMVPVARRWLARLPITRSEIWLSEMPTSQMSSVAAQGDLVVCQPADAGIQDNMVYAYSIDGSTIIRRVRRPEGRLSLVADDAGTPPITIGEDGLFTWTTLAQIVGAIRIQPAG